MSVNEEKIDFIVSALDSYLVEGNDAMVAVRKTIEAYTEVYWKSPLKPRKVYNEYKQLENCDLSVLDGLPLESCFQVGFTVGMVYMMLGTEETIEIECHTESASLIKSMAERRSREHFIKKYNTESDWCHVTIYKSRREK